MHTPMRRSRSGVTEGWTSDPHDVDVDVSSYREQLDVGDVGGVDGVTVGREDHQRGIHHISAAGCREQRTRIASQVLAEVHDMHGWECTASSAWRAPSRHTCPITPPWVVIRSDERIASHHRAHIAL